MFHAFRVRFRSLGGDADRAEQFDNEPMPGANAIGEFMAGLGQEDATIGQGGGQALALEFGRCS